VVNGAFRDLTLPRNPNLWHCLPAEKQYGLENHPKPLKLEEMLADLNLATGKDSKDGHKDRKHLYNEKVRFLARRLRRWQKRQPYRPGDPAGYHLEIFHRYRFTMPTPKRLAQLMFEVAALRSPVGIQATYDMMVLCTQEREVEFRPGPEPDKCGCFNDEDAKLRLGRDHDTYDWKHIYDCYKRAQEKLYGFAELRFLRN
jgi:hypothetical protein